MIEVIVQLEIQILFLTLCLYTAEIIWHNLTVVFSRGVPPSRKGVDNGVFQTKIGNSEGRRDGCFVLRVVAACSDHGACFSCANVH